MPSGPAKAMLNIAKWVKSEKKRPNPKGLETDRKAQRVSSVRNKVI